MAGTFDPEQQVNSLPSKIVAGLERISGAFKVLLWEQAKANGVSPLQLQILIFIGNHQQEFASVGYLSNEFQVSTPTLSDAVKVMVEKSLVSKEYSRTDGRRYTLKLTTEGSKLLKKTALFSEPLSERISNLSNEDQTSLFSSILKLIQEMQDTGVVSVNRNCFNCRYYDNTETGAYCHLLNAALSTNDIRLDCPEFEDIG